MKIEKGKLLFRDLELAGIKNFSVVVSQLIDVNATAVLIEIDRRFASNIFLFEYHFSKKVKDLHVVTLV